MQAAHLPPPKKRFGQNFLVQPGIVRRIVAAVAPRPEEALVEIGPGPGALTRALLEELAESPRPLLVIELDRDMLPGLRALAPESRLEVLPSDALEVNFGDLAHSAGRTLRIVGNLPYNISTPLLFHLLESAAAIIDMHVMLQREVIERMAAAPGESAYGRLTVMLAPWVSVEPLFEVGPGAFQPPPRVWSAVARLTVLPGPRFAVHPRYGAVVSAAFSHRRKTVRNALRGLVTTAQLQQCGVDPGARPETLAPQTFNALAELSNGAD